jgi:hypothetical protein
MASRQYISKICHLLIETKKRLRERREGKNEKEIIGKRN